MIRKYKGLIITQKGTLTSERGTPVLCPVNSGECNRYCAWYAEQNRVVYCQDKAIGAIRGDPVRSFRLHTGPRIYEPMEPQDFELQGN